VDVPAFQGIISNSLNLNVPLKTPSDIENAVEHLTSHIQQAAYLASTVPPPRDTTSPKYPLRIRELIQLKRRARHRWQATRLPAEKRILNRLSNLLKKELSRIKCERYDNYVSSLSATNGSLWTATKRLLRHATVSFPLRKPDGSWASAESEKAELFASHLQETFKPHADVEDAEFTNHVNDFLDSPLQLSLPPTPFSEGEVKDVLKGLPTRKSPGYDLIDANILKSLPAAGIKLILYIFNAILRICHFPIQWKFSIVVMFNKPGKSFQHPSSYRPISLLPVLSKVFERLFLQRITNYVEQGHCIPSHQFGFRRSHSTIQQLHRVVDFIADGFERRQYAMGVFLDVSSAFDRVWHKGLLYKLKSVLPDMYYRILYSFLQERYFKVRQGQALSELKEIKAGVPQGAILSPLLYSVFTADIPQRNGVETATYADDTLLLVKDHSSDNASRTMQGHLLDVEAWLTRWRIKINATKSVQVTFALRRRVCPPLFLCNNRIPQDTKVKYLGLWLDKRLTWNHHLRSKRLELNARLKTLYWLLRAESKLKLKQKILLYKVLLQPLWSYGIQIFGSTARSNLRTIEAFQSKFLRLIVGAPYYVTNETLHRDLKMPSVKEVARNRYQLFHKGLGNHSNTLVRRMATPNFPAVRRLRRSWSRDLLQ
jgi:hypothetical protein